MNAFGKSIFIISLSFSLILSGCSSPANPESRPDQTVINVFFSSSISELVEEKIYACQIDFPNHIFYQKISPEFYLPEKPLEISLLLGHPDFLSNEPIPGVNFYQISSAETVVLVNTENRVQGLTAENLRDILSGAVQNWADVEGGGSPAEIQIYTTPPGSDLRQLFDTTYLLGSQISTTAEILPSASAVADKISRNPAGIGITLERYITSSNKKVQVFSEPRDTFPVLAAVSENAEPEVIQLINCLSIPDGETD